MKFICVVIIMITFSNAELVRGVVYDIDSKNPVENVNIILPDLDTGTVSDKNGLFEFNVFKSGVYTINASMIGYESLFRKLCS